MILQIIVGIILILGGIAWALLAAFGTMMASRAVTRWETTGRPALGLIAVAAGILLLVFA